MRSTQLLMQASDGKPAAGQAADVYGRASAADVIELSHTSTGSTAHSVAVRQLLHMQRTQMVSHLLEMSSNCHARV